jgi:putative transposase
VRIRLHRQTAGKLKTCSILHKNGKYYACFSCEVAAEPLPKTGREVGIDLGLTHLAITSDEQFFSSPKYLRKTEHRLKQLQRTVARKKKGSTRRKKAVLLLAKCHEHIANQRREYAHKISHFLVQKYDLIGFEALRITGMVRNHRLAKSIVDAGWGQLVQFTTYKAESAGKCVVQVNPYETTQRCSQCNELVPKELKDRVHRCPLCGYVADRDVNAAINVLHRAQKAVS